MLTGWVKTVITTHCRLNSHNHSRKSPAKTHPVGFFSGFQADQREKQKAHAVNGIAAILTGMGAEHAGGFGIKM